MTGQMIITVLKQGPYLEQRLINQIGPLPLFQPSLRILILRRLTTHKSKHAGSSCAAARVLFWQHTAHTDKALADDSLMQDTAAAPCQGVQKSLGKQHDQLVALSRTHHCTADPIRTHTL